MKNISVIGINFKNIFACVRACLRVCLSVCFRVRAYVRACVLACACVCVCMLEGVFVCMCLLFSSVSDMMKPNTLA